MRAPWTTAMLLLLAASACATHSAAGGPADPVPPAPLPSPLAGWEDRLFAWRFTSAVEGIASRTVTVLLPEGYAEAASAEVRYPVLYLHDGQNCLDHDGYGHGGWQVHRVSTDLAQRGLMAPVIVVMIDNGGAARTEEYFPGAGHAPGPTADRYLDFLEQQVVPFVDATYRTAADREHRAIGGSSYGGLISLHAGWTRTATWGRVMALSPALVGYSGSYGFERQVTAKLPLRVYLDSGTVDWGGGDDGLARTNAISALLVRTGWTLHGDLEHAVGNGHNHSEEYWRARLRPSTDADVALGPDPSWPGALVFVFPPG
ncbi:MAG: alpha/beta hydrolase-fold protein [Anaeromyxobacter sp.]